MKKMIILLALLLLCSGCADPHGLAVHPSYAGCAVWLEYLYTHAIPDEE